MTQKSILTVLIFLYWLSSSSQNGITDLKADEIIPLDEKVRYGKLDNGFTYYIKDNDSEITEFRLEVKVGSFHEDDDQLNYAHLLEHMLAKYHEHFPDVEKYFNSGGRFSQARTQYYNTSYYANIPSNDKEGMENAYQLLRDYARLKNFDQDDIDVERYAVLGEGRVRDVHNAWLNETIEGLLLANTNLNFSKRSQIRTSMNNFSRSSFLNFHEDWYRPDLQAAIIVGDIDVDSAEVRIKGLFADLKMPDNPRNAHEKIKDRQLRLSDDNQYITVLDTLKPGSRMYIVSKNMNRNFLKRTRQDYKEMLLQEIYEDIIRKRSKELQRQYEAPYQNFSPDYAASTVAAGQVFASMMTIDLNTKNRKDILKRFQKALIAWKQIHANVDDIELLEAKNSIESSIILLELKGSVSLATSYANHFVYGAAAMSAQGKFNLLNQLLDEIDLVDIQTFFGNFGDLNRNTDFLTFTDTPEIIPSKASLKKQVVMVKDIKVKLPSSKVANINTLNNLIPHSINSKDSIVNLSKNLIGVTSFTLANGIKVILKPTSPRESYFENRASIRAIRPNNIPLSNTNAYLAAIAVPEIVPFFGVDKYSKFDIEKFQKQQRIEFNWDLNKNFQVMEGTANVDDIDELLNLFLLYTTNPRKNKKEFDYWKEFENQRIQNTPKAGGFFYENEIKAIWYPQVPNLGLNTLRQLKMDEILKSYEKWFSDFQDYTFIVTGDFDATTMASKLSKKLSVFPVNGNTETGNKNNMEFPLRKIDTILEIEQINQAFVTLYFPVKVPKDIKTLAELNLVGKALHHKVWERLRRGAYSPSTHGQWLDSEEGIYGFNITFDSELDNYENMISMAMEEFLTLKENGVESDWLKRVIKDEKNRYGRRIQSFGYFNFWPDYLQEMLKTSENSEEIVLKYESLVDRFITLEDVNRAAKDYLKTDHLQKFILLPKGFKNSKN